MKTLGKEAFSEINQLIFNWHNQCNGAILLKVGIARLKTRHEVIIFQNLKRKNKQLRSRKVLGKTAWRIRSLNCGLLWNSWKRALYTANKNIKDEEESQKMGFSQGKFQTDRNAILYSRDILQNDYQ